MGAKQTVLDHTNDMLTKTSRLKLVLYFGLTYKIIILYVIVIQIYEHLFVNETEKNPADQR